MVKEVFEDGEGLTYVPMLCSNQSSLEGRFSSLRRRGHDKATTFGGGCYQTSNRQSISAQQSKSASYDHDDSVKEDTTKKSASWKIFQQHIDEADVVVQTLLECRQKHAQELSERPS